jgi:hypothetical protein
MTTVRPPQMDHSPVEVASSNTKPLFLRCWLGLGRALQVPVIGRFPLYALLGLLLNVASWVSSWERIGPSNYTFFPLWLGFILFLDGLNVVRSGTSPATRSLPRFVLLFALSIPCWWLFEFLNIPIQNWHYVLDHNYSGLEYNTITSIDFSTVLPAVMEMAELLVSFAFLRPRLSPTDLGPRVSRPTAIALMFVGATCLILPWLFPRYAFGLIWLGPIFLLDPINNLARTKSAWAHLRAGDIRFFITLPLAALLCGFWWETWNFYALPKWRYDVPLVNGLPHLFEMPILGYTGYLPFGVELFVLYQFLLLILGRRQDNLTF